MTRMHVSITLLLCIATFAIACVASATAAVGPVKLVPAGQIGWQVDKTTNANICTVASKDECQQAHASGEPQGFEYPEGVAGATNGDIYVTDRGNRRIQELTAAGEFVLMFGKDVNATTHGDVCTEIEIKESAVKCQAVKATRLPKCRALSPIRTQA